MFFLFGKFFYCFFEIIVFLFCCFFIFNKDRNIEKKKDMILVDIFNMI